MRNKIIVTIEQALKTRTKPFLQELDVQIFLFYALSNAFPKAEVLLEYPIVSSENGSDAVLGYLDLMVVEEGNYFPIEIKFKTSSAEIQFDFFGEQRHFHLKTHLALNHSCYGFWKDIERMEALAACYKKVQQGIGVFISNEPRYWKGPESENTGYAQFSLKDNRIILPDTTLDWNGDLMAKQTHAAITLKNEYKIQWKDMALTNHKFFIL